jgi:hypothetical protein
VTFIPDLGPDAPRNFPVHFALESVTVGGGTDRVRREAAPIRAGDRITYERGTLREIYDLRIGEMEQSFVLDELETRGEIAVRVRVASELARGISDSGLSFSNEHGRVGVSRAIAIDAVGTRTPLETKLAGDALEIRVPADVVAARASAAGRRSDRLDVRRRGESARRLESGRLLRRLDGLGVLRVGVPVRFADHDLYFEMRDANNVIVHGGMARLHEQRLAQSGDREQHLREQLPRRRRRPLRRRTRSRARSVAAPSRATAASAT